MVVAYVNNGLSHAYVALLWKSPTLAAKLTDIRVSTESIALWIGLPLLTFWPLIMSPSLDKGSNGERPPGCSPPVCIMVLEM